MITDRPPKSGALKEEYLRSEALLALKLPPAAPLNSLAEELKGAMAKEDRRQIESLCNAIAANVSLGYEITSPKVKVLGVRPLEEEGNEVNELFGDYDFASMRIRLWMRTAVQEKVTSFGTLLSTLCHEICHHLDVVHFGFENTFHTRGFYERAGLLYHHERGTPMRALVWDKLRDGVLRINWPATMRGAKR